MGKTYEHAVAAATRFLPAHIEFRRKTIANQTGLRERTLRLLWNDMDLAAIAAARAALTQDRSTIDRIIHEDPHFLHMHVEGVGHSKIFDLLVDGIARQIVDDIAPTVSKAYDRQFEGLGATEVVQHLRHALTLPKDAVGTGNTVDTSKFEKALADFEADPCYETTLGIMATVDGVSSGLERDGRREAGRRVLEAGYYIIENGRTDRFAPAPKPARRRRTG